MSRTLTSAVVALALIGASSTGLMAIRSKTREAEGPAKPAATATAASALKSGFDHLTKADELDRGSRKAARKAYAAALRDFQTAVRLAPDNYRAHNGAGYAYRKLGNFERALHHYDRALELSPAFSEAIEYRAEAYLGLNRLDEAKRAYMHLFVHDRTASNALMNAMQAWVSDRRTNAAGVAPGTVTAFAAWVEERQALAGAVGNLGHNSPDWK